MTNLSYRKVNGVVPEGDDVLPLSDSLNETGGVAGI